MVRIEGEIVIRLPVEDVFDFVADERNEPRFNSRMRRAEQISEGPIGVGSRFRAEMVSMGRTVQMVIEFTGYERPRRLASSTHMSSMDIQYTLTFEPVPDGTRMRWYGDLEPRGILKLMSPVVAGIWAGARSRGSGEASSISWREKVDGYANDTEVSCPRLTVENRVSWRPGRMSRGCSSRETTWCRLRWSRPRTP